MDSSGMGSNSVWLQQNVRNEPLVSFDTSHETFSNQHNDKALRKRKFFSTELEDRQVIVPSNKIFVTEEKIEKELETIPLKLSNNTTSVNNSLAAPLTEMNNQNGQSPIINELGEDNDEFSTQTDSPDLARKSVTVIDDEDDNDERATVDDIQRLELHQFIKDSWKKNGGFVNTEETSLLNRLFEMERKKLSMQLVPYMPVIPSNVKNNNVAQSNTSVNFEKQVVDDKDNSTTIINNEHQLNNNENIDHSHLFKKPFSLNLPPLPDVYTVEEPPEIDEIIQGTMKRSYSQSANDSNNLSIVEIKDDMPSKLFCNTSTNGYIGQESQPLHFISEPPTLRTSVATTHTQFNITRVRDCFVNCIQADGSLLINEYKNAYEELCTFVSSLGVVFDFATKDLRNKLLILEEHLKIDPTNYETIQKMVDYEVRTGRCRTKELLTKMEAGKPLPNGCRTLLRLHRALGFIKLFLSEMRLAPTDASSAKIAWNAYTSTLGRYHAWIIQQTIHAAIKLTIPTREQLIEKMICNRSAEELDAIARDLVEACNKIEQTTQDLYEKNNLLNLT
ncbi:unnamed protein product [Didymodactylos carnosus]|uniref:Glycolipid transfer protein domain-containing protein n=1 Tax=Didymodactylos carnosus TaxID=1234261 RepID=A0A814HIQ5_9BILA|nr:unnamed protein product [Didymodactylos carnosus]CAF1172333.1 unnamed protein product [Didymodactylos carnosus]CAF3781910.1 unnamed protein product [Didymodactylos carnosus]CAF3983613.1 unnamed protein product [Didymodactylos carnosus]